MPLKCMARRAHKNNFEMLICGSANMWGGKVQLRGNITTQVDWQVL